MSDDCDNSVNSLAHSGCDHKPKGFSIRSVLMSLLIAVILATLIYLLDNIADMNKVINDIADQEQHNTGLISLLQYKVDFCQPND